jgi:hypothetical protein
MIGIKNKRLGKFYITFDAIEIDHEYVYRVMGEVIVIRAEVLLHMDSIEYIAISKHFDIVEEGFIMPEYKAILSSEKGFLRFEKC